MFRKLSVNLLADRFDMAFKYEKDSYLCLRFFPFEAENFSVLPNVGIPVDLSNTSLSEQSK